MDDKICENCRHYFSQFMYNCSGKIIPSGFGFCNHPKNENYPPRSAKNTCSYFEVAIDYNLNHEIRRQQIEKIQSERDKWLLEKLKEHGYEFSTDAELFKFAKERCHVLTLKDDIKQLWVGDELIAAWEDKYHTETKITENGIKSIITYGRPIK